MKILIADALADDCINEIKGRDHDVTYDPDLGSDELADNITGFDVLVVRSTRVTSEIIDASDRLSLVIRAGSGVNTIDLEACARKAIFVSNCPGLNSVAVAELAMAHILSLDRNIPDCVADLRNGTWDKAKYAKLSHGLKGRTLGIIGFGNIGQEVCKRAEGFGMKIVAFDPVVSENMIRRCGAEPCSSVVELCSKSNIITVHVPLNNKTEGLIGQEAFEAMQEDTFVINTSRGGVLDEKAFLDAAVKKNIRGGFDVFPDEPGSKHCDFESELSMHPSVYGTHHIGASTKQAQIAVGEEVVTLLDMFSIGAHIKNCVNIETHSRARSILAVRHYDRVGVLAEIFRILKEEGINIENMENIILKGEQTAFARIKIDKEISDINKITRDPAIKDDIIDVETFAIS